MKDDFLHSITHDLRNPMTSIRGFMKFLIDEVAGPLTPQQRKMLETMDRASLRLLVLINDILDIAKLEAGRMKLNLAETDLRPLAQRTIEIAEGQALKKSIRLVLQCPDALPLITADPELLERVFSNLIGNALKFTPDNGQVTVALGEQDGRMRIAVEDTGEGIPPEYIDTIFHKFQQVAGQRRGGTGLGLTICKHIVEAHLGTIWAESALGTGSKFIFLLPLHLTEDELMKASLSTEKPS
jgi:signal transduction histidine kinase